MATFLKNFFLIHRFLGDGGTDNLLLSEFFLILCGFLCIVLHPSYQMSYCIVHLKQQLVNLE